MKLTVEKALEYAMQKHAPIIGRNGHPYVEHVIRVARQFKNETLQIIALWHDLLEDTDASIKEMRQMGANEEIIKAVKLLTHDKDKISYQEYLRKLSRNPLALLVKIADVNENYNNIGCLTPEEQIRIGDKYIKAKKFLYEVYMKGKF